ncbi:MAG TPA: lipid-A-disaccharide synthase [Dissulfurispiraceae bacterium]|nr:lipid-A-disaccharide synthase [Dissulfurispiraceae bacterium]
MIIAGESSGELYGAYLARAIKHISPEARILGVGGDRMAAAGVELLSRISSSFGLIEAARTYRELKQTFRKAVAELSSFKPQVLVLIDYPDFNLRLAEEARKRLIKILYYVSPQIWAWRKGRINKISKLVDKMAVILPFEENLYLKTGLSCEFVGHPVMDEIRDVVGQEGFTTSDLGSAELKRHFKQKLGLDPGKPLITVMPGSRRHEILRLMPVLSSAIHKISGKYPGHQLVIPVAPNVEDCLFDSAVIPATCRLLRDCAIDALAASDAAIIASGTSTLQAALIQTPMVVVYRLSPLTFFVGRLIVKVKFISLVNLLLEKSACNDSGLRITELLQDKVSTENIVAELTNITNNNAHRAEMISQLASIKELYEGKRASARVAEMVQELCNVHSL